MYKWILLSAFFVVVVFINEVVSSRLRLKYLPLWSLYSQGTSNQHILTGAESDIQLTSH